MNKILLLTTFLLISILSGCKDESVDRLENKITAQQAEIEELNQQLDSAQNGGIETAAAAQSEVNESFAYHHAGAMQWLPIWNADAIAQGDEILGKKVAQKLDRGTITITPSVQPSEGALLMTATLWIAMLATLSAMTASARFAWIRAGLGQWARRRDQLQREVAALEKSRKPITDLDLEIRIKQQELAQAQATLDATQAKVAEEMEKLDATIKRQTNLDAEIERDKATALEAFRKELRAQQAKDQRSSDAIDKGLADL